MTLTASDIARHKALGIDGDVLRDARVIRVTSAEAAQHGIHWRGDLAGVLYPRVDPRTGVAVGFRVRRDHPEIENDALKNKYVSSLDRHHLYLTCVTAPMLNDTTVPIVVVEAEKSALMVASVARRSGRSLCPIATGGCWSWRGKIGKVEAPDGGFLDEKGPLPDLGLFNFDGREVIVWFDGDTKTNQHVKSAQAALVAEIKARGGKPKVVQMPVEIGVNGPDDYRSRHDDAAILALIDGATAAGVYTNADEYLEVSGVAWLIRGCGSAEIERALAELGQLTKSERDPVRRSLVRDGAVLALKQAGVGAAAKIVDAALRRQDVPDESPAWLRPDTPSPEPVDVATLLDEVAGAIGNFVAIPQTDADAIALWILGAWTENTAAIQPMLYITSPTKRCGKTTAMIVAWSLTPRALTASNITAASLFRLINEYQPTLLLDEADSYLPGNELLRGILNSGHLRSTALVFRCDGDDHKPKMFSTWGPKVVVGIGQPSGTIADRSILIRLQRKRRDERVARLRQDRIESEHAGLRSKLRRFTLDHAEQLRDAEPVMPTGLNDRAQDNWRRLIAIADVAGGLWPERARHAALAVSADEEDDNAYNVLLLADVAAVWPEGETQIASSELLAALHDLDSRPWKTFGKNGTPLTSAKVAGMLKGFGIKPHKARIGCKTPNVYERAAIDSALARYAPDQAGTPEQVNQSNDLRPHDVGTGAAGCSGSAEAISPGNIDVFQCSTSNEVVAPDADDEDDYGRA